MTDPSPAPPPRTQSTSRVWLSRIGRLGVMLAAAAAMVFVVRSVGTEEVLTLAVNAAPFLPLAVLLEFGRIALDAVAGRVALGARGAHIPLRLLIASQIVAHGVMNVTPAGRSSSEAAKATLLAGYLGAPAAIAMGTTNQANVLLSSAFFSLPCAVAAHLAMHSWALTLAIVAHFVVLFVAGAGLRLIQVHPYALAWAEQTFPRWSKGARAFAKASRETPILSFKPIALMSLGRLCQTAEYGVLAHAVGLSITPLGALAVQGLNLVAAAVGVMVPGQLGSSEAIFALGAEAIGSTTVEAVSIALLAHSVSLGFAALGLSMLAVWVLVPHKPVAQVAMGTTSDAA
jgi:hypothetical protein